MNDQMEIKVQAYQVVEKQLRYLVIQDGFMYRGNGWVKKSKYFCSNLWIIENKMKKILYPSETMELV